MGKDIEFIDRPEKYVAACNAVVNFWKDHTQPLNDLKHGFRLLPFDRDTFEDMIGSVEIPFFRHILD
ncbi:hypothetical protein ACFQAS_07630 [Halopenitus salinus]|uniref:Uncharacterized protein n=1 Tax=Halopenitus salinus TaxID=1198295 RepID=A0ABD5UW22_9EURY